MSARIGDVVTLQGIRVELTADDTMGNCQACAFYKGCPSFADEGDATGGKDCIEGEWYYKAVPGLQPNVIAEASPVQSNTTQAHDRLGGVVSKL